jgi:peptide/nickel transport system substrate-binding protein
VPTRTQAAGATVDRVVVAQGAEIVTLDPNDHNDTTTANVINNIYEPLVQRSPDLQLRPALAESWTKKDDTIWEFKLRKNVKWHDGTAFTADDVKFTVDRYLNKDRKPRTIQRATTLANIVDSATVIDPNTVQIKTKGPGNVLILFLPGEPIVQKALGSGEKGDAIFAEKIVGTGPFKFVEFKKSVNFDMEINKDYWGAKPSVQFARFRPIPDQQTRLQALLAGEVDVINNVPPELVPNVETDKTTISSVPSSRVFFIILNTTEPGSPLGNIKVRQAMNHAIDRDAIMKSLYRGYANKLNGLLTTSHFGYNSNLPEYKYDPAKAKQLLTEAGYPNGFEITFNHPTGRYQKDKETAEVLVAQWDAVGIKTKVGSPEWTQYSTLNSTRKQAQAFMLGWGNPRWDADGTLNPLLRNGQVRSYWDNDQFNKLIDEALITVDDKKREQMYQEAGLIHVQDATHVFLWQFVDLYGYNKSKIKWQARADEAINIYEMTSAK